MSKKHLKFIFLHGAGGTKDKWRKVLPLLPNENAVAIDLAGHGSHREHAKDTIEAHAKELSEKITEDSIVAGHSMGGLVALELAKMNDHVKGIALVASTYEIPVHPKIIDSLANGIFPEFLFKASYGKNTDPALLEEEENAINAVSTEVAKKDFQACADYKQGEKLIKGLSKPIVAILGAEDRLLPKNTADALREKNEDIIVEIIDGAGHYNLLETPEEVVNALMKLKDKIN